MRYTDRLTRIYLRRAPATLFRNDPATRQGIERPKRDGLKQNPAK